MNNDNIIIRQARRDEAEHVAKLIMTAMTDECCLWFCGEGHDISDFHKVMTTASTATSTRCVQLTATTAFWEYLQATTEEGCTN